MYRINTYTSEDFKIALKAVNNLINKQKKYKHLHHNRDMHMCSYDIVDGKIKLYGDLGYYTPNGAHWMMFSEKNYEYLNLSCFDVSDIKQFGWMFSFCKNLRYINLSGWKLDNTTEVNGLLYGCNNLETVIMDDGWDMSKITLSVQLFPYTSNLKYIYLDDNFKINHTYGGNDTVGEIFSKLNATVYGGDVKYMKDVFNACPNLKKGLMVNENNKIR